MRKRCKCSDNKSSSTKFGCRSRSWAYLRSVSRRCSPWRTWRSSRWHSIRTRLLWIEVSSRTCSLLSLAPTRTRLQLSLERFTRYAKESSAIRWKISWILIKVIMSKWSHRSTSDIRNSADSTTLSSNLWREKARNSAVFKTRRCRKWRTCKNLAKNHGTNR